MDDSDLRYEDYFASYERMVGALSTKLPSLMHSRQMGRCLTDLQRMKWAMQGVDYAESFVGYLQIAGKSQLLYDELVDWMKSDAAKLAYLVKDRTVTSRSVAPVPQATPAPTMTWKDVFKNQDEALQSLRGYRTEVFETPNIVNLLPPEYQNEFIEEENDLVAMSLLFSALSPQKPENVRALKEFCNERPNLRQLISEGDGNTRVIALEEP